MITYGALSGGEFEWWHWLVLPVWLFLSIPFVSAPQLSMLALIRLTNSRLMKSIFLGTSVAMFGLFGWFLVVGDFTGSSTAAVVLTLYPLSAGVGTFVGGAALLWVMGRLRRRN